MEINYKAKYLVIILVIISGYFVLLLIPESINNYTFCIFKSVTGVPCPSCGSTRSTLELLSGNFKDSILLNPFGLLTTILIAVSLIWMSADIMRSKDTFFPHMKKNISNKYKILLLIIVLVNWIWNIQKGL